MSIRFGELSPRDTHPGTHPGTHCICSFSCMCCSANVFIVFLQSFLQSGSCRASDTAEQTIVYECFAKEERIVRILWISLGFVVVVSLCLQSAKRRNSERYCRSVQTL